MAEDIDGACGAAAADESLAAIEPMLAQVERAAGEVAANPDLPTALDKFAADVRAEAAKLTSGRNGVQACGVINSMRSNFERRTSRRAIELRRRQGSFPSRSRQRSRWKKRAGAMRRP